MTNGSSYVVVLSCSQGKIFDFTNLMNGTTYMYNVSITNIVGSSNISGVGKLCSKVVSLCA